MSAGTQEPAELPKRALAHHDRAAAIAHSGCVFCSSTTTSGLPYSKAVVKASVASADRPRRRRAPRASRRRSSRRRLRHARMRIRSDDGGQDDVLVEHDRVGRPAPRSGDERLAEGAVHAPERGPDRDQGNARHRRGEDRSPSAHDPFPPVRRIRPVGAAMIPSDGRPPRHGARRRRRRRALPATAWCASSTRRRHGRRQRRRRPRAVRPARLARPRHRALHPRRAGSTTSAAGACTATPPRALEQAARARATTPGSGWATSTSGCTWPGPSGCGRGSR